MAKRRKGKLALKAAGSVGFTTLMPEQYREAIAPVPVDVWTACFTLYQAAARFETPVTNPAEYKVRVGKNTIVEFTDIPMNRGMVAVKEFMRDQPAIYPAVVARMISMNVGGTMGALRENPEFAKFFQPDRPDGSWNVAEALIEAFATAPFLPEGLNFDLKELHRIASEILASEPD